MFATPATPSTIARSVIVRNDEEIRRRATRVLFPAHEYRPEKKRDFFWKYARQQAYRERMGIKMVEWPPKGHNEQGEKLEEVKEEEEKQAELVEEEAEVEDEGDGAEEEEEEMEDEDEEDEGRTLSETSELEEGEEDEDEKEEEMEDEDEEEGERAEPTILGFTRTARRERGYSELEKLQREMDEWWELKTTKKDGGEEEDAISISDVKELLEQVIRKKQKNEEEDPIQKAVNAMMEKYRQEDEEMQQRLEESRRDANKRRTPVVAAPSLFGWDGNATEEDFKKRVESFFKMNQPGHDQFTPTKQQPKGPHDDADAAVEANDFHLDVAEQPEPAADNAAVPLFIHDEHQINGVPDAAEPVEMNDSFLENPQDLPDDISLEQHQILPELDDSAAAAENTIQPIVHDQSHFEQGMHLNEWGLEEESEDVDDEEQPHAAEDAAAAGKGDALRLSEEEAARLRKLQPKCFSLEIDAVQIQSRSLAQKRKSSNGVSTPIRAAKKMISDTEMECPLCKFRTYNAKGWCSHLWKIHSKTPAQAGVSLRCECGKECGSEWHREKCRVANFTVVHNKDLRTKNDKRRSTPHKLGKK